MLIHCNAGIMHTNLIGDPPGYGMVFYHKYGISNILYLAIVKHTNDNLRPFKWYQFVVHESDASTHIFEQSFHGITWTLGKNLLHGLIR